MSELKAFNCVESDLQEFCEPCLVYLKDDADKVIAHSKYKRCLAMARWCGIGAQFQHNIVLQFNNPFYIKRAMWLEKWRNRWLAIAKQFKEAK